MNNDTNWDRLKEIFSAAIEIDEPLRSAYVVKQCKGDPLLREEIESWLASYHESPNFIENPVFTHQDVTGNGGSAEGRQFGSYRIIREIGFGGMGAVYLAERTDGEFDQQVALKVVRQSIAESHIVDRFRRERQILASLHHPYIARLLDGGVSDNGEPFIAMEYIDGEPITEFIERADSDVDARLALFLKVCAAVSYAHNNLVVHRDLKPGNILVTSSGDPKLLDFGLAKLIDDGVEDGSRTQTAFRALTPAYASPEQLRGDAVTTASDVYSLGVVLYETLTGGRPFHFEGKGIDDIIRTITDVNPTLPSRVPGPHPRIESDLDNIVLNALNREPERRYRSVDHLADDIQRFRNGLPVNARPNTVAYRARKFIARHRFGVAAAAVILIILLAGLAATAWQYRQARREKERAERINAFFEETMRYSNPILSAAKRNAQETTVNEVLDEAAKRLEGGEFDYDPQLKLELERTIATTYYGQGRYQPARQHMAEFVRLLREQFGENDAKYITGSVLLGSLLFAKGDMVEAEAVYRQYLPLLRAEYQRGNVTPEILVNSLNDFAYLRRTQGDSHESETTFRETLELVPHLSDVGRRSVATTRSTLASTIADQGRFDEALTTAQQAVDEYTARGETDTPNYGFSLTVLGGFLTERGDFPAADTALTEAERIFRARLNAENLWIGDNVRNQAISLYNQGRYAEALTKASEAAKIYEEGFGKHYDQYPTVLIAKGLCLVKTGHVPEGNQLLREAVELRTSSLPASHFWVAAANGALGESLTLQKRYAEAEPLLRSAFESLSASQEPSSPRLLLARRRLVALYQASGRPDLAEAFREDA